MYLYTVFRSILDTRVNLRSKEINDDILNIFIFIDLASEDFFSQTKQSLAENLESESKINLIMNSIMAMGISSILIIYMIILNNQLRRRIIISNRILALIPIILISKSTKIKKFINRLKKNKK
ncbi:MAG: hypothetical protein QG594_245 [Bacteroidota bacterium]|nr:hypothetical protein [Bacteroidota bacterium]